MLTGAIILKQVHWTYMPPLPPLLFAVLHVNRQTRKAALSRAPAYAYIYAWRTPVLDGRPGPFHGAEIAFTFDNAELCDHSAEAAPRQWHYRIKSVLLGRVLPEPVIPITTVCLIGRNIVRNTERQCSSINHANCATIQRAWH